MVEDWAGLDGFLDHFQQTCHRMSRADFPVVAAPVGMSKGSGFEVVLHAQQVIAHANCVTGLVESSVGLVPAGGGCKETLYRWKEKLGLPADDISEASWKTFINIGTAKMSTSPLIAKDQAMLYESDTYLMNRDRLLDEAVRCVDYSDDLRGEPNTITEVPMVDCAGQQLNEAVISDHEYRYLIHDSEHIFSIESDFEPTIRSLGIKPIKTP